MGRSRRTAVQSQEKRAEGTGCRGGWLRLRITFLRVSPTKTPLWSCGKFQKAKLNVERLKPGGPYGASEMGPRSEGPDAPSTASLGAGGSVCAVGRGHHAELCQWGTVAGVLPG